MAAGLTAMRNFDQSSVARLNRLSLRAVEGIRAGLKATGVTVCVTGSGSFFRLRFKAGAPSTPSSAR
jgi:glutamate-1-semialdehyde aminotransferase